MAKVKVEIRTYDAEDGRDYCMWYIESLGAEGQYCDTKDDARQDWLDVCKALRIPDDAWEWGNG